MASSKSKASVLIVGAGPVGLLTALRLGQAGVSTLVVENHDTLLRTTRAMVYMPVIIPVLRELGIMAQVEKNAVLNSDGVAWRDLEGNLLGQLPLSSSDPCEFGGVLLMGQWRMTALILEELKRYPSVEIKYGLRCVGIEEMPSKNVVRAMFHERSLHDEDVIFEADYLVAADGANSAVRRMLCIPFEGFTHQDFKMIGTDCIYDFAKENDFTPLNFIVHPTDWAVIAYSGEDEDGIPGGLDRPLWRVAYVEPPDLLDSKEAYLKRAYERIPRFLKGAKAFKIARAEPYWLHQRCAAQARKGRVVLAGDALHSNNPIGGLGLTGGILDSFCYGNALTRVIKHGESDALLTECANSRRQAWLEATSPLSQNNMRRLYGFDEGDIRAREGFFTKLRVDPEFPKTVRKGLDKMMVETFEKRDESGIEQVH